MKILIVAWDFPWPKIQGGHLRLTTAVETLAGLGDVDLFAFCDDRPPVPALPSNVAVARLETATRPRSPRNLRWRAAWLARRGIPLEVAMHRMDSEPRLQFDSWSAHRYDLVWFDRAATFEWMGRPDLGPTIVDLHDLEDEKARLRAGIMKGRPSQQGWVAALRRLLAVSQTRLNARDWGHFQRAVAHDVDRVVLCSELDVRRSGLANAVVVPNTYEQPTRAVGRIEVGQPPIILFQATFDYAPNIDAVEWMAAEVLPLIRARVPTVQVRLVGKPVRGMERLHGPPALTVVGVVPAMEPELARADIAVVPIRYGSGTRFKILESFAHRVPVVSTTLGAEGLRVEDGVHILLADDPDTFAAACERLLTEPDLRKRLVDAAEERYLDCYESSIARERIEGVVRDVVGTSSSS